MSDTERRELYHATIRAVETGMDHASVIAVAEEVMAVADAELESANGQIEARRIELLRVNERYAADRVAVFREGWLKAARFLRRTPCDSVDFHGALRGARLIEDEVRRRTEETTTPDEQDDNA